MGAEGRRKNPSVADVLRTEPYRFDFFQAVRVLERIARDVADGDAHHPQLPVGHGTAPSREVVRFRALPSHHFPAGAISRLNAPGGNSASAEAAATVAGPWEMVVTFMGLTGPQGVLPHHYTATIIDRLRSKDFALRDFFDLFNHRAISLFYRAWEKYRFFVAYERAKTSNRPSEEDFFTQSLFSLLGLGTAGLRHRLSVDDEALLYYGGHFAHRPRNAISLERMLADYFEVPVEIQQFFGQWLYLSEEDQSRLPCDEYPDGLNNQLGVSLVVGERVWDMQGKFRVRLGPVDYRTFLRYSPMGDGLRPVCEMTRMYVDMDLHFDIQVILLAEVVPWCQLGDDSNPAYLGWNTWVRGDAMPRDADDAVFSLEGRPQVPASARN